MKRLPRPRPSLALLASLVAVLSATALTPTEWKFRQPVAVPSPGLVKVALPPATFDVAQPGLGDLRLADAEGREVAALLDQEIRLETAPPPPATVRPKSFTASDDGTQLLIATGTNDKLVAVLLETPAPFFLKAAHVEVSDDGAAWRSLGPSVPLFRQFGAEQLRLNLEGKPAAWVRITLDHLRTRAVAFTAAQLVPVPAGAPAPVPVTTPVEATLVRRDEFAGESVLTVALPARNLPLASLTFAVQEPVFMRRVTIAVREADGAVASERVLAAGTIYRVDLDGSEPHVQLSVPVAISPHARELLVHVQNGDSPPLGITTVAAAATPVHLIFQSPIAGTFTLLAGNPQARAPHYDLAAFASQLRTATAQTVSPGPVDETPGYHPRDTVAAPTLAEVPLVGAPLDAAPWTRRKDLTLAAPGVQELELDPAVLAGARDDQADLRVVRAGKQVPYLLERTALARSLPLTLADAPDAKRPTVSRWRITLPHEGLPLRGLTLATDTSLFRRDFRILERVPGNDGRDYDRTLAREEWQRTPELGVAGAHTFVLQERPATDTLFIETDNGDNPALVLTRASGAYPVSRLIFKAQETDAYALLYGNADATAPRYDLGLVAPQLLTAPRQAVRLGDEDAKAPGFARAIMKHLRGGVVLWVALGLVVVVLLVIVAKMLPKPPATI